MRKEERVATLDLLAHKPFPLNGIQFMTMKFFDLPSKEYLKLLGPFLVAGIVGVASRIWYPLSWPAAHVVRDLSGALIVVWLIGSFIELFSARFLIQRVADDLAERLVGRGLPSELQGQIGQIVKTTLVRDHFVKSYHFSDPNEGYVRIDIKLTCDVKNYSDSVQEYAPTIGEESFYDPEFVSVDYGIRGGSSLSYTGDQLTPFVETDPHIKNKNVKGLKTIKLDPIKTNPAAICQVILRYRVRMREDYSDIMAFGGPTIGFSIQADRIPEGFEFFSSGEAMRHEPGSPSWNFDRPFLPGQHVRAWWFRKRDLPTVPEVNPGPTTPDP